MDALRAAGCETPDLDAALLIADALRVDRAALVAAPERGLTPAESRLVMERVRRRVAREPVAYILGRRWFRELELAVDSRALVPRPETELLVEVALELPHGARGPRRRHRLRRGCARDQGRAAGPRRQRVRRLAGSGRARARQRRAAGSRRRDRGRGPGPAVQRPVRPRRRQPALRARGRMGEPRARDHPLRAARRARRRQRRARRDPCAGGTGATRAPGSRSSTHPRRRRPSARCSPTPTRAWTWRGANG